MNQIKGIPSPLSQSHLPNISCSYMEVKIDAAFVVPPIMESQVKFHRTWQQDQWCWDKTCWYKIITLPETLFPGKTQNREPNNYNLKRLQNYKTK